MKFFALLLLAFFGLQQGRLNAQSELLDQTPLFFEDFEGYPENGYPGSFTQLYNGTGNANQKVITTAGADGADTKVFRLQGASSWASEHIVTLPATLPSVLVIDALIKPVSGAWPGRFGLRNPTGTWGTRVSAVLFDGSGKITALRNGSDSDKVTLGTYSMNVWYRITLVHDIGAKTYDVYIDGELLGSGIPMHATLKPTQFHLTSGNSGTNEIYYENTGFYEDVPFLMTADFSGSARNGCLPLEVQFSDLSTGSPDGWAWYFGDENFGGIWEEMSGAAGWEKRDGHSSVALPDGSILVIGGMTTVLKNDVWRSADLGASWTLMTDNAPWAARKGHSSVSLPDGSILLLGGHDGSGFRNDVWRSADRGATWTLMTDNAAWTPRDQAPSAALPDGSVLMMSGRNGMLRDVWRSEDMGATWTLVTDNVGWTPRDGAACALLPDSSLVMLGGGSGLSNDVWRSEDFGATWTRMTAAAGWSGRIYHACVALPDGTLMVAGGSDPYGPKNDVWFSKDQGATWTEVAGSAGWTPRYGHSAVVLPGGDVLIIGGRSPESSNDVWWLSTAGSTEQNPVHTYAEEGHFPVTLQVHRPGQAHTVRRDGYISSQAAPAAAGTITGTIEVCAGDGPFTYSIPEIDGATSYLWTLPQGATGSSTSGSIEVAFDAGATSGEISVSASNACGSGAAAILNITVNPVPPAPEITQNGNTLQSSAPSGNQWYDQNGPIVGAAGQTYTPQTEGAYYAVVTLSGCSSEKSNTFPFVITGLQSGAPAPAFRVYPNPVSSELVLEMAERTEATRIELLDIAGQIRFRGSASGRTVLPIGHLPKGVYLLRLENTTHRELRKIVRD